MASISICVIINSLKANAAAFNAAFAFSRGPFFFSFLPFGIISPVGSFRSLSVMYLSWFFSFSFRSFSGFVSPPISSSFAPFLSSSFLSPSLESPESPVKSPARPSLSESPPAPISDSSFPEPDSDDIPAPPAANFAAFWPVEPSPLIISAAGVVTDSDSPFVAPSIAPFATFVTNCFGAFF